MMCTTLRYKTWLLLALLLPLSACDFLDIIPVGRVIPTTTKEFRELLTSAYNTFPEDRGLSSMRSDEYTLQNAASEDKNSYYDIWRWNDATPDDATAVYKWRQAYNVIFTANHIIESEGKMLGGTPQEETQLVGEAYMLRAYTHFILVNLFGNHYSKEQAATDKGVPIKINNKMDDLLPRSSVQAVYDQILSDMDAAMARLNQDRWATGLNYRVGREAAWGVKARVMLYMGHWQKALDACDSLLATHPDVVDIVASSKVLPNSYDSPENIWALEQLMTTPYIKAVQMDPTFMRGYQNGDLRKSRYYKAITAVTYIPLKGGGISYRCSMRSAEFYLTAAEAAARLGNTTLAVNYLNILLSKRYNATAWSTRKSYLEGLSQPDLISEILHERALELACEGHRWFDLRRTTQPQITRPTGEVLQDHDARYTIPIPTEAKLGNPNLNN